MLRDFNEDISEAEAREIYDCMCRWKFYSRHREGDVTVDLVREVLQEKDLFCCLGPTPNMVKQRSPRKKRSKSRKRKSTTAI